ncbi:hypothetical protein GH714_013691 [Hevea brasiliensis]|uniref:Dof zinc finger protein n=1 Tax=Hevea brasiliensis TaxID=3981 RepID=A0A6A6LSQ4_HEVBR|nr:hypothetical protein GH714_013691 [Hevea brasiliensis]
MADRARLANIPMPEAALKCPRCESTNTKFCYFNNYSLSQPRHFCKTCRRYWTRGGALRNVPVGGGCRRDKRSKGSSSKSPVSGDRQTGSGSSITVSSKSGTSDILGLGPQVPPLRFMAPLHHLTEFATGDIGGWFGPLEISAGAAISLFWGLDSSSSSGLYPFEGGAEQSGYGSGMGQLRPKLSTSLTTQLASVKMEDNNNNQELNLSRQLLGIPGMISIGVLPHGQIFLVSALLPLATLCRFILRLLVRA